MKHEEGYQRIAAAQSANAVRWWFYDEQEDGLVTFARGGWTRTCRLARAELRAAREVMLGERAEIQRQPTHELMSDGSLVAVAGYRPTRSVA